MYLTHLRLPGLLQQYSPEVASRYSRRCQLDDCFSLQGASCWSFGLVQSTSVTKMTARKSGSRLETEIERCRSESQWDKIPELVRQLSAKLISNGRKQFVNPIQEAFSPAWVFPFGLPDICIRLGEFSAQCSALYSVNQRNKRQKETQFH